MKKHMTFFALLIIVFFQCHLLAQNQSILLPFSGDTYPVSTGSKMINFTNSLNPIVTTLPKHDFSVTVGNDYFPQGNPHIEDHLKFSEPSDPNNVYLFNEKYLGQHPMFAQQIVHDNDGNLLFFIVDNNIYNRNGEA